CDFSVLRLPVERRRMGHRGHAFVRLGDGAGLGRRAAGSASTVLSLSITDAMNADTARGNWRRLGYSTFSPWPVRLYCGKTGTSVPLSRSSRANPGGGSAMPRPASVALRNACAVL